MDVNDQLLRAQLEHLASDPTAGTHGRVFFNTTSKKPKFDNGTSIVDFGSGTGGLNFISNPDFESDASGYSAYADAAATTPVDGTGGAPTVTITRQTANIGRGTASGRLTKDAANRQGEGFSYDFTVGAADASNPCTVSFFYYPSASFVSGTDSTTGDVVVYVYDRDTSTLIQTAPFKLVGGVSRWTKFTGEFQLSSGSTNYRLVFHIAGTTASAWTLDFEDLSVSTTASSSIGAPSTGWVSWTPTGSWVANTTYTGRWRRVGEQMEIQYFLSLSGAPTSASLTLNLPSGYSIDTSKLAAGSGTQSWPGSSVMLLDASTATYAGVVQYQTTTTVLVRYLDDAAAGLVIAGSVTQAAPFTFASSDSIAVTFSVPIAGWGSTVVMSNDTSTRVVAMRATGSTTTVGTSATDIINGTVVYDTHGAYNSSTGVYTVPVAGKYRVTASNYKGTAAVTANQALGINLFKNGSQVSSLGVVIFHATTNLAGQAYGGTTIDCVAGDTLKISGTREAGITATAFNGDAASNWVCIERLSGPSQIAASENISAHYQATTATSFVANGTVINYDTKVWDSHGAVTTGASWKFTAPVSGKYSIRVAHNTSNGQATAVGQAIGVNLAKGGSTFEGLSFVIAMTTSSTSFWFQGSTTISLNAGEYIAITTSCSLATTQPSLSGAAGNNYITIDKIAS